MRELFGLTGLMMGGRAFCYVVGGIKLPHERFDARGLHSPTE